MSLNSELKNYAYAFANFLMHGIEEKWFKDIKSIILFGSVAQNRATEESDVDIFFDVAMPKSRVNKFRRILLKAKDEFLFTTEALKFKSRKIYNEINFAVGNLEEWPEMKKSVSSSGLVLYGKYSNTFKKRGLKRFLIFFWESTGKNRGAFLNKLYGYKAKRTRYKGFLDAGGVKIGKSAALIPVERKDDFIRILDKYRAEYKVLEVYME